METICKVIDKELGAGWAVGMGLVRGQRQECFIMACGGEKRKQANGSLHGELADAIAHMSRADHSRVSKTRGEGACSRLSAKRSQKGPLRSPAGASSLATGASFLAGHRLHATAP
ncbi:hypothetical protein FHK92_23755 [Pseudomonas brassicacearum subsp. neoaurantiaca]|uniref:Uncharacterized protein n=1 Tax=Pseudomonas brassicacearum subsp. neoaurantiaca TaxID=494916 RepID=A0A7V8ZV54_9PSED|nr:hypothetical protein [Pseudomonas brassicacearum subsp. neoaurantiaca]